MSNVIIRPNVKRVIVRAPGPQGPPGEITGVAVSSVAGRTGDVVLTKGDVGLSNVDNTADASKPVSTAQAAADSAVASAAAADATTKANAARSGAETTAATALAAHVAAADPHTGYQLKSEKGQANGYASLDGSGRVPALQLPPSGSIGGTLGTTDNALTRADGTGGSTAQGSTAILDDSGNISGLGSVTCTAFAIAQLTYSGRTLNRLLSDGTNESVVIGPSGTGYFSLLTPDGTTAGGNQRGNRAVDFNVSLALASNVASGTNSFACGADARASGSGSFAFGNAGASTIASNTGAIAMGQGATASGLNAVAIGGFPTASGNYGSTAFGYASTAAGDVSTALGERANAHLSRQVAMAGGNFAVNGDAQFSMLVARGSTAANSTPVNLSLDNALSRIVIPANTAWSVDVTIIARTTTANAAYAVFRRQCLLWRGVGVGTTVCSTVVTIGTDQGSNAGLPPTGWAVAISADTTNGALNVQVTGSAAAGSARWVADIELTEVANP